MHTVCLHSACIYYMDQRNHLHANQAIIIIISLIVTCFYKVFFQSLSVILVSSHVTMVSVYLHHMSVMMNMTAQMAVMK